jgi:hypothetical protein
MATYERVKGVVCAQVGDDLVLLNPNTEVFFALNETAARIWEELESPASEDDLVSALRAEFDVTEEHCRTSVGTFLHEATTQGVLHFA